MSLNFSKGGCRLRFFPLSALEEQNALNDLWFHLQHKRSCCKSIPHHHPIAFTAGKCFPILFHFSGSRYSWVKLQL